jgi:hypothetical protein
VFGYAARRGIDPDQGAVALRMRILNVRAGIAEQRDSGVDYVRTFPPNLNPASGA